ncbi:MAG TPA: aldehyde dehydrogenase family protein, partial [Solirubrobacteraceae bacterium]|nr:aldehyde dehydrogenase family protein [Solirubrobacteraceae bacterium]
MTLAPFANEPLLELRRATVREEALRALTELDARLPLEVPMLIGEDVVRDGDRFDSVDPGLPGRVVARATAATAEHVGEAIARAERGFRDWSRRPAEERAAALLRAAEL